jgi:two-component system NtrC family response regulator
MLSIARVLLAGGEVADLTRLREALESAGHQVGLASTLEESTRRVAGGEVDVVVLMAGLERSIEQLVNAQCGGTGAIVVMAHRPTATSVRDALHGGASEVVDASADSHALVVAVERAARESHLRRELAMLRARFGEASQHALVGRSAGMAHVRELIGRAAGSRVPVLITGEPGTGKDAVARLVHDLSDRSSRPFATVRCGDADRVALERELFGTAAGGDVPTHDGLLERCHGGTIVLEDAASLPIPFRAHLSAVARTRRTQRLGGTDVQSADVRLVLVTRTLAGADAGGAVDDLLNAFNAMLIDVPPLRDRRSDIPQLVHHFRRRLASEHGITLAPMSSDEMIPLLGREWSGNVRELEHWVERAALMTRTEPSPAMGQLAGIDLGSAQATLEQLERAYILHVLEHEGGHQSRTAVRLGIDRRTLYRKLKQYRTDASNQH